MSNEYDPTFFPYEEIVPPKEVLKAVQGGIELGGEAIYFDPKDFSFAVLAASVGEQNETLMRVTKVVHTFREIREMRDFTDRVMDALRLFNKHAREPRVRWGFFMALANYLHHNAVIWAVVKEGLIAKAQFMNTIQNAESGIENRKITAFPEGIEPQPVQIRYERDALVQ